jgi:hypothetical protein
VKRTTAVTILAILLFNSAGFYVYYAAQLQNIRHEMREALKYLPDNELQLFKFTKEVFEQAKVDEHELKINGKMYDIARVENRKGLLYVFCRHDEKEDNLIKLLHHVVTAPVKHDSDSLPHVISQYLSLVYIVPDCSPWIFAWPTDDRVAIPFQFVSKVFQAVIDSPPPWQ